MRRRQTGIFLVSAALAVGVVGVLVTFWGVEQSRQMRVERAERIGESLKIVGHAVETFTVKHHGEIEKLLSGATDKFSANGETFTRDKPAGPGVVTEIVGLNAGRLITALKLPGVGSKPPRGVGEYAMRVYRVCDAGSTTSCRIETLTYLTEPIKKTYSSEPDFNLIAIAAKKMGVYGGLSTTDRSGEFRFIGQTEGALTIENPLDRPGLIAMRGGSQTKDLNNAVTRDGSRAMTGNLNLEDSSSSKKHSIVGVRDIKAEGALEADEIKIANRAVAKEMNSTTMNTDAMTTKSFQTSGTSTFGGTLNIGDQDLKNANTIEAQEVKSKRLRSTSGIVELNDVQSENDECNGSGIAVDGAGKVLSCQLDAENMNRRLWKLSGTPKTKADLPDALIGEVKKDMLTDMVLVGVNRGEEWTIWRLSVNGTASLGGAHYRPARNGYSASNTMVCGFSSRPDKWLPGGRSSKRQGKLERDRSGDYTLSGSSNFPLLCLTRPGQWPTFEIDKTFKLSADRYSSKNVEFDGLLADLMSGLGGYETNQIEEHAIGTRMWAVPDWARWFDQDAGFLIKGARSCNAVNFFRTRDDKTTEYGKKSIKTEVRSDGVYIQHYQLDYDVVRATCRFDTVRDINDAGFEEVI